MNEDKHKLQGEVKDIPIEQLIAAEWNPNEMSPKEFDRLAQELSDSGVVDPIQVFLAQDGKYQIIGGHHRVEAAKVLGWPSFPCVVLEGDKFKEDDYVKFLNMKLNIIRGKISAEKFVALYEELSKKYDKDTIQESMGFVDQTQFDALLGQLKKDIKNSNLPDAIKDKFEETANELKTIDDISNILNFLFSRYGSTLDVGYMILVYGGQEHVYVSLEDKRLKSDVKYLTEMCTEKNFPIEEFFKRFMSREGIDKIAGELATKPAEEGK